MAGMFVKPAGSSGGFTPCDQSMEWSRMSNVFANTGIGPSLVPIDIGHAVYTAVVEPDTAFWSLVRKDQLADVLADPVFVKQVHDRSGDFAAEMDALRFGLVPSAVYFNPTERCNLNCTYCYLPEGMRRNGEHMSKECLFEALETLLAFFRKTMPVGDLPQVIFHGAEPMLNRAAIFAAIDHFADDFIFGVQTNGTLLDAEAIEFLTSADQPGLVPGRAGCRGHRSHPAYVWRPRRPRQGDHRARGVTRIRVPLRDLHRDDGEHRAPDQHGRAVPRSRGPDVHDQPGALHVAGGQ